MTDTTSSPQIAPVYILHRKAIAAPDSGSITNSKLGVNMGNYEYAHIQVVPDALVDPDVAVMWWSEAAGKFVQEHTAIAKAGVGAAVPYEFTVECRGRIMFVFVSAVAGATVSVWVSGFNVVHPS